MGHFVDRKIVLVTRPTQLKALGKQFGTRGQAKFQMISAKKREIARGGGAVGASATEMERLAGAGYAEAAAASELYDAQVQQLRGDLDFEDLGLPVQLVDRDFLPNFVFGPRDVVVTVGQDGLVANTAKYAVGLPIVAVNPDPSRIDGVLLPFHTHQARAAVRAVIDGKARLRPVTLAEATLADGQTLLAFNELFIGCRSHVSARYRITVGKQSEPQSSSGILVSTGAGSTGWLSSLCNMVGGLYQLTGQPAAPPRVQMKWESPELVFAVREPFASKSTGTTLAAGLLRPGEQLTIESEMPSNGVIFSDGIEADFVEFNAGAIAHIAAAKGKALLAVP